MPDLNDIKISLSQDEALILFALLLRLNESEVLKSNKLLAHQSEQRVLWDMEADLEKIITEQFKSNYITLLNEARERVKDEQ